MLLGRTSRWWLASVFILFTALLFYNVFYFWSTGNAVPNIMNLDEEWNVPTFFSAVVFLSLFFPLILAIARLRNHQMPVPAFLYGAMGACILFLIADEVGSFHDGSLRPFFFDYCDAVRICFNGAAWVWFYLPIVLVVGFSILFGLKQSGFRTEDNRLFVISVILFFSVFIIEWIEPVYIPYANFFQEWVEIVAAILFYMHFETEAGWKKT